MNIILQHWTGDMGPLEKLSSRNISAYAERIGADYKLLRGNVFRNDLSPPSQKLFMLDPSWDEYEWVVMLDMDMFAVNGLQENVFTDVDGTGLYSDYTRHIFAGCQARHPELSDPNYAYWGGAIYRLPRELRRTLRKHTDDGEMRQFNCTFHDEGIMHRLAARARIKQDSIPKRWCWCSYLPEPEKAAMIHIRRKVTPQGPRVSKAENYVSLLAAGVLS